MRTLPFGSCALVARVNPCDDIVIFLRLHEAGIGRRPMDRGRNRRETLIMIK